MRFFLFERCILGIETANFDPNARRLTKLELNEIFIDFAMSREPFDEIDSNFFYFKGIYIYLARTPEIGQGLGRILSCGARKPEQT